MKLKHYSLIFSVVGILVCILFLISGCSNGSVCKTISTNEKLDSTYSNEKDWDYYFGDIIIIFSPEDALTIINNEPPDGMIVEQNKKWICTLNIDYPQGFSFKFEGSIEYKAYCLGKDYNTGEIIYIKFFDNKSDFNYVHPDSPDDIYKEVVKTIPLGYYLVRIYANVNVDVYDYRNGHWVFYKNVKDSEEYQCRIIVNKNRAYNNISILNFLENHPNLFLILRLLLHK